MPDYARAMEGEFGRVVRLGIENALGRFVDLIEDPTGDDGRGRAAYVNLGRGEMRAGRSLDALLSAYRLGSRLAWRRFVEAGPDGGLKPEAIYALGEAIFAYIDELSAESAEGYAEEQSASRGSASGCGGGSCGCSHRTRRSTRRRCLPRLRPRAGRCRGRWRHS